MPRPQPARQEVPAPVEPTEPHLRCADWARQVEVDPIGTAAHAAAWLLLDWPLPWPRDVSEVAALEPVRVAMAGRGIRLQLVVSRPDDERREVVLYDHPADADGWFSGYRRQVREVDPADLIDAAIGLVRSAPGPTSDPSGVDPSADLAAPDLLVCGHGSRDRCCGSMGTALVMAAAAQGLGVRRTSHTGGHRFAPTGIVLPQGTAWAFLDEALLDQIITTSGPIEPLLAHYRGNVAYSSPAMQAAEREAFAAVGWPWLQHRRRASELGDGLVRVDSIAPDGQHRSWWVRTGPGRQLPVPDCGADPAAAKKTEWEVVVISVDETAPERS